MAPARLFHLKNRRILKIILILSSKIGKFAHSDAEAPLSVFLFRRINKGNLRHKLSDIIVLIILGRLSKCVGRTEIIDLGVTIS
nr:hypothetical protein [uncultured Phocaeicola sp.]